MKNIEIIASAPQRIGFFESLKIGQEFEIGSVRISLDAALSFSNAYDPLSIHVDEGAAKQSMFGGFIISGLQSISAVHALSVIGGFLGEESVLCGAGFDELKFIKPVRPGDILTVTAKVKALKPPRRPNGPAIAALQYWVSSQDGTLVMTFIDNHVLRFSKETTREF